MLVYSSTRPAGKFLRGLRTNFYEAFGKTSTRSSDISTRMWHRFVISHPLVMACEREKIPAPCFAQECECSRVGIKLKNSINVCCFIRISLCAFTLHVLVLLCIGLRSSFFYFEVWMLILTLMMFVLMIDTITWGMARITRSARTIITIRHKTFSLLYSTIFESTDTHYTLFWDIF